MDKKRILIVDDDQNIVQAMVKGMVSKRHDVYDTIVAMDGYEALEAMKKRPVDCIVLDLRMSNFNGLEVLEAMKTNPDLKNIDIVISSGFIDESMKLELETFGIEHMLQKPYPINKLIETIDFIVAEKTGV